MIGEAAFGKFADVGVEEAGEVGAGLAAGAEAVAGASGEVVAAGADPNAGASGDAVVAGAA